MKNFLVDVMSRFTSFSKFGVLLSGGDHTKYAISPQSDSDNSLEDLQSQINGLTLIGGNKANLALVLKDTLKLLNDQKSGFREGVPKVFVILITSHRKPSGDELKTIRKIQSLGNVFVVGGFGELR